MPEVSEKLPTMAIIKMIYDDFQKQVENVNVNKLVQTGDETLVLNCGTSSELK